MYIIWSYVMRVPLCVWWKFKSEFLIQFPPITKLSSLPTRFYSFIWRVVCFQFYVASMMDVMCITHIGKSITRLDNISGVGICISWQTY